MKVRSHRSSLIKLLVFLMFCISYYFISIIFALKIGFIIANKDYYNIWNLIILILELVIFGYILKRFYKTKAFLIGGIALLLLSYLITFIFILLVDYSINTSL